MSVSELACVYSALLLVDDNIAPTSEKIATVLKAANIEVEPYWPELFAKALETVDIKKLITNVGSCIGSSGSTTATATPAAAAVVADEPAKKEEKKEESDESDDDLGLGLFD